MTDTKKHPFDYDALRKGTWIECEELEAAVSCRADDPSFQQRVLGEKMVIETRTGILSRIEGQRLRLMTDSEAQIWVLKQAALASRSLQRAAVRIRENVDAAQLSSSEQVVHEHASRVLTEMALAQQDQVEKNKKLFALIGRTSALPEEIDGE